MRIFKQCPLDIYNLPNTDRCIDHLLKGDKDGYAQRGKIRLHRVVFELYRGYLPKVVMHSCDNPRCINPKHLVGGTQGDNNRDRAKKGRSRKSVPIIRTLSQEQADWVRAVYKRRSRVYGTNGLAKILGVNRGTIGGILQGRTYK